MFKWNLTKKNKKCHKATEAVFINFALTQRVSRDNIILGEMLDKYILILQFLNSTKEFVGNQIPDSITLRLYDHLINSTDQFVEIQASEHFVWFKSLKLLSIHLI